MKQEEITIEIFNHLVHLAELELEEEEANYLRSELNNQLNSIHELDAIPIDAQTPLASHGVAFTEENSQALREDDWIPFENTAKIMKQVPLEEDDYIVVPNTKHTTLE
ncbi:MAG: hypothetical protein JEZ06_01725 [Anaerolineaceae bacterium]|nr:hypothetical protein [Anaerolineaceae bacterium]